MNTILLVNPWIYDFTAYDLWAKPLGLLYLAAHLRKKGYRVYLLDCLDRMNELGTTSRFDGPSLLRIYGCGSYPKTILPKPGIFQDIPRYWGRYGMSVDRLINYLKNLPRPDSVMITCGMTYWYPGAVAVRHIIRTIWPKIPVILGGTFPVLCPDWAEKLGFDGVIEAGDPVEVCNLLDSRFGIRLDINEHDEFFAVWPAYDLYRYPRYAVVLTSIGCPFQCTYCASNSIFPCFWQRDPEDVFGEIRELNTKLGIQDIAFYDDALLYRADQCFIPLMERVIASGMSLRFHLPNSIHARYVTSRIARLMFASGVKTIRISLESSAESVLQKSSNKVAMDIFGEAVDQLLRAGYTRTDIGVYILFGLPGITENEYWTTVEAILRLGLHPKLSLYSPIPTTQDFQLAHWVRDDADPLYHNKIAMLYLTGKNGLYERLSNYCAAAKVGH